MLQASLFHCPSFDLFPFEEDGLATPGIDVGRGEIVQALVIAPMVVVPDKGVDLSFLVTWQKVVFQEDPVLQGLMPAFYLALGLRMIGRAARVRHALSGKIFCQIARDARRPVV